MPSFEAAACDIAFVGSSDAADTAQMIRAMDAHYRPGETLPPREAYLAMVEATLASREGTRFALARGPGGAPLGLACIAVIRPGRDLQGLVYLKDLFVVEEARGRGIGRLIMGFLARFAQDSGIGRIDFTTDRANADAQRLYCALGARAQEKVYFVLSDEPLKALAGEPQ